MLQHVYSGGTLPSSEVAMFEAHPEVGASLISHIPRLEAVAEIIAYQDKRFAGSDPPEDGRRGNSIPLGARILKLALDVDALTVEGVEGDALLETIFSRRGWYDPDVVVALGRVFAVVTRFERQTVGLDALAPGMVLAEDVVSEAGVLIIVKGQEVTSALTGRLQNFLTAPRRREQITVLVPVNEDDGESQVA